MTTRTMVLVMLVEEHTDPPRYDAETTGYGIEDDEPSRVVKAQAKPMLAKCGALVELARRVAR